jgi:Formate/nitrite family of transporters
MYTEVINKISDAAEGKVGLLNKSKGKYIISSALAGMFIGLGIILIYTIGGNLNAVNSPVTKTVMGACFGIALSLVILCGSDLFTGNTAIMTISTMEKRTTFKDSLNIWIFCYLGNLLGSVITAFIYSLSGLTEGNTGKFIVDTAIHKMSETPTQLFIRGLLCNILVCLATWSYYKLKSESAKLIMIFWCLFAFITSGFEHSIANMTLLAIALFIPHAAGVTVGGYIYNVGIVTIGNFVGGMVFIALTYWYISKDK